MSIKQHLIDPEICIRCNSCEESCPRQAVTHDSNNYVVDAALCEGCGDCLSPCPTGAISSWRMVLRPYSLAEQFSWLELPAQEPLSDVDSFVADEGRPPASTALPPPSAPTVVTGLARPAAALHARLLRNVRLTAQDTE